MSVNVEKIYKNRFCIDGYEIARKNKIWQVLCRHFFQKWIDPESVVLDVGAGYCEFINNVYAQKKIAVDINADTLSPSPLSRQKT